MKRTSALFVAVGIAAASLSSCSRSNYAFNTTTPTPQGSERVAVAPATAGEVATAVVTTKAPVVPSVATQSVAASQAAPAAKSARLVAKPAATAPVTAKVAAANNSITSTIAASSPSRAERKALRHQVKQIIASHRAPADSGKSQLVAVLLCFFLGGLGIHDFYMGYTGKGILQIVLSILIVGFILVIIDLVRLLTGSLKPKDGDWAKTL